MSSDGDDTSGGTAPMEGGSLDDQSSDPNSETPAEADDPVMTKDEGCQSATGASPRSLISLLLLLFIMRRLVRRGGSQGRETGLIHNGT